jgi:pimeloyl-ACP methyl ester carboxylesterase
VCPHVRWRRGFARSFAWMRAVSFAAAMPIVYLASSRDSVVPRANAEEIAHHAPSSRLVVIDGPHMALYTNPKAAADAVCRTLAGA